MVRRPLPDAIELPGWCEQRGFGDKPVNDAAGRLTHVLKYVGKAWYQRDLDIPPSWAGKRVELFLERCHWETTVWVDGRQIGTQNSLSAPHRYDFGISAPGKHILTVCVDNTYKLDIGSWAHAITEDTQGNWNGIIGRLELRATDPVWIREVQVYPGKIQVKVGNQTDRPVEAILQSQKITIPIGGGEFEMPFVTEGKPWDEFAPELEKLTGEARGRLFADTQTVTYGLRDWTTRDQQFLLNGRPVLARGPVDECVYPLTGYPPMDKAAWLRVLGISKAHGFNFMRFHSWCPPEAAFAAADDLGFLLQVELPLWIMGGHSFGKEPRRDQFIRDELDRVLDTYGNHPSFAFMAMGNESSGDLKSLVKQGRARDSRRLYRCENGITEERGDFAERGLRGALGPRTDWDRSTVKGDWVAHRDTSKVDHLEVPSLAHEVGQWAMYPNLDEAKNTPARYARPTTSVSAGCSKKSPARPGQGFRGSQRPVQRPALQRGNRSRPADLALWWISDLGSPRLSRPRHGRRRLAGCLLGVKRADYPGRISPVLRSHSLLAADANTRLHNGGHLHSDSPSFPLRPEEPRCQTDMVPRG
jgi:hypothetical protein